MEAGPSNEDFFKDRQCECCGEWTRFLRIPGPGVPKDPENLCGKCRSELRAAKRRAMGLISKAKKDGDIQPQESCQVCHKIPGTMSDGRTMILAHHAYGYEQPLKIWWLCHHCNQRLKGYKYHCGRVSLEQARAILGVGGV